MIVKKLVVTKHSHYFRRVKNLTKSGLFVVEHEKEVCMFDNKKQIFTVEEMFESICKHRDAYLRNKKIETILEIIYTP
jgi:hypothetical protein